jgi:GxxExxY protein
LNSSFREEDSPQKSQKDKIHKQGRRVMDGTKMMSDDEILSLCDVIRQTGYDIHVYLGSGHLEKVYENALAHRLIKQGINVVQQSPLQVFEEDGTLIGSFFADLFIEDQLIAELKACKSLTEEHSSQLFGYLKASRIRHGLLINFGASKFQIRKFVN